MSVHARNDIPRTHQFQKFSMLDSQVWRESLKRQQARDLPSVFIMLLRNYNNLHLSNRWRTTPPLYIKIVSRIWTLFPEILSNSIYPFPIHYQNSTPQFQNVQRTSPPHSHHLPSRGQSRPSESISTTLKLSSFFRSSLTLDPYIEVTKTHIHASDS